MEVIFNRPRVVGGKLYRQSAQPQMVDDKHLRHWFFVGLCKAGDVTHVISTQEVAKPGGSPKVKENKVVPKG